MAYLELKSGKILGAKKNTLSYYHEVGHIIFNKRPVSIKLRYWREHLPIYAILYLSLQVLFLNSVFMKYMLQIGALVSMVLFVIVYEYEEVWCWLYALKVKRELKDKNE